MMYTVDCPYRSTIDTLKLHNQCTSCIGEIQKVQVGRFIEKLEGTKTDQWLDSFNFTERVEHVASGVQNSGATVFTKGNFPQLPAVT